MWNTFKPDQNIVTDRGEHSIHSCLIYNGARDYIIYSVQIIQN